MGADGTLTFARISDGRVLLAEKAVRALRPAELKPASQEFLSLDMFFKASAGERIYGLGQHAAFPWDKDFPVNGQLDQKGVPRMLLEPHDGDVTIPVAHSSLGYVFLSNLPSTAHRKRCHTFKLSVPYAELRTKRKVLISFSSQKTRKRQY